MKPNIELHIDRLVMEGFSRNEAQLIGNVFQKELTRLISEGSLHSIYGDMGYSKRFNSPPIEMKMNNSSQKFGAQLASNIYSGIKNSSYYK